MAELSVDSGSNRPPTRPPTSPQKPKLRRKVAKEDRAEETTSIQRLVEYFVVVSSQPRWETMRPPKPAPPKASVKAVSPQNARKGPVKALTRRRIASTNPSQPTREQPESRDEETPIGQDSGNIHMPLNSLEYTFKPAITARFPEVDYADNPLNPMILQFCYPHSDSIVPSTTYVLPKVHHFVLTNEKGRKIYGTCLTVYDEYQSSADEPFNRKHKVHDKSVGNEIEVTVESEKCETLYIPRVLCLISYWPYLTAFREYLTQLFRLATTTDLMHAPLERYVLNICLEIPAPPPGAFEVHINILQSTIKFWAPPAKLPIAYVALPYQTLFDCLEINNILLVWYALLMEQKVLLISSQYSILTIVSEILCSLLFPMQWSHLYVPMLPKFLSPMLDAPIPYLVGVIRENWMYAEEHVSAETIVVDLDNNKVTLGPKTPKLTAPPAKKWNKLQSSLEQIAGELFWKTRCLDAEYRLLTKGKMTPRSFRVLYDAKGSRGWKEKLKGFDDAFSMAFTPDSLQADHDMAEDAQSRWDKVQESFLRFFASTLKTYRKFLHKPEQIGPEAPVVKHSRWTDNRMTFDRDAFVVWQKAENYGFYHELCLTQLFDDFITKRMYNPDEADVIFFDQTIDAKNNRSRLKMKKIETPFLQSAKAHKILKTLEAVEPNEDGLPGADEVVTNVQQKFYRYESWPESFDSSLFGEPRPIPMSITAEFDRQASLAQRLESSQNLSLDPGADLIEFYGADYDPSPEVATFTVFFFCYSAVVGLEWQDYKQVRKLEERSVFEMAERDHDTTPEVEQATQPRDCPPPTKAVIEPTGDKRKDNYEQNKPEPDLSCNPCSKSEMDVMQAELSSLVTDCLHICPGESSDDVFLAQWSKASSCMPRDVPQGGKEVGSLLDFEDDGVEAFEEARAVTAAQLDLAFDSLSTMSIRGLPTDADAFKSLMEACGRCGNTDRAKQLIKIMKRDGFVADSEIYSCFMTAFAQDAQDDSGLNVTTLSSTGRVHRRGSDAYSTFLRKKVKEFRARSVKPVSEYDDGITDILSEQSSDESEPKSTQKSSVMFDIYSAVFSPVIQQKNKDRKGTKNRRRSTKYASRKVGMAVPDSVLKQVVLGESLLEYLYPDLRIDASGDSCPKCSNILGEDDVVSRLECVCFR
jgi:pentatricopeptide repeat protein